MKTTMTMKICIPRPGRKHFGTRGELPKVFLRSEGPACKKQQTLTVEALLVPFVLDQNWNQNGQKLDSKWTGRQQQLNKKDQQSTYQHLFLKQLELLRSFESFEILLVKKLNVGVAGMFFLGFSFFTCCFFPSLMPRAWPSKLKRRCGVKPEPFCFFFSPVPVIQIIQDLRLRNLLLLCSVSSAVCPSSNVLHLTSSSTAGGSKEQTCGRFGALCFWRWFRRGFRHRRRWLYWRGSHRWQWGVRLLKQTNSI